MTSPRQDAPQVRRFARSVSWRVRLQTEELRFGRAPFRPRRSGGEDIADGLLEGLPGKERDGSRPHPDKALVSVVHEVPRKCDGRLRRHTRSASWRERLAASRTSSARSPCVGSWAPRLDSLNAVTDFARVLHLASPHFHQIRIHRRCDLHAVDRPAPKEPRAVGSRRRRPHLVTRVIACESRVYTSFVTNGVPPDSGRFVTGGRPLGGSRHEVAIDLVVRSATSARTNTPAVARRESPVDQNSSNGLGRPSATT